MPKLKLAKVPKRIPKRVPVLVPEVRKPPLWPKKLVQLKVPADILGDVYPGFWLYRNPSLPKRPRAHSSLVLYYLLPRAAAAPRQEPRQGKGSQRSRDGSGPERTTARGGGSLARMQSSVEILGTRTSDTPGAALVLAFPQRRYVFGRIAEGTQRQMLERKHAMGKVTDIFVTGTVRWDTVGGLLGLILTIADVVANAKASKAEQEQKKQARKQAKPGGGQQQAKAKAPAPAPADLTVHGGENLAHVIASARHFVFRQGLDLALDEDRPEDRKPRTGSAPDWEDEHIQVWKVGLEYDRPGAGHRKPVQLDSADGRSDHVRKHRRLSDAGKKSGGDLATSRQGQLVRNSVVRAMFKDSHVPVIATRRVGQVQEPATVLIPDERNVAQRFDSPLPEGPGWSAESALALVDTAPLGKLKILPPTDPARVSCSYIVKSHARRGRFLPERAKALGVHVKDYSRLTSKETVVTRSGSEVTPEMVLEPDVKGSGFAVVDLWNGKVPASLFGAPEFRDGGIMDGVQVIYYIVDYCKDLGTLREFMELHRDKKHVLLSQGGSDHLVFQSAAAQALTMHAIDPDRFPVPRCDNRLELPAELGRDDAELQVEVGRPGAALKLAHQSPDVFDDSGIIPFQDTDAVVTELRTTRPEVLSLAQAARDKLADPDFVAQLEKTESEIPGREAEIVTIGTGSALPSKYRNVSATLVRVPGHGNYLFDCGENTLGQLRRMVPPATLQSIVQDLRAIFISHLHADHHLGTVSIIDAFRRATRNAEGRGAAEEPGVPGRQVLVLAPSSYLAWLEEYDKVEKYGYGCVQGVPLSATGYDPAKKAAATTTSADFAGSLSPDFSLADFGLTDVQFCSVDHTRDSVAVAMTFRNGLKVAYSGDCRPSRRFAGIGRGAHLLVHECTFADGLEADAADKKHSTMSEALGVARDMGARRVVLTHFSQRYPKTAVFSEQAQKMVDEGPGMVVLFAFDGMRVRLGDFAKAQLFLPALRKLYEPDEDPDAEKAGGGGGEPLSLQDEQRGSI